MGPKNLKKLCSDITGVLSRMTPDAADDIMRLYTRGVQIASLAHMGYVSPREISRPIVEELHTFLTAKPSAVVM